MKTKDKLIKVLKDNKKQLATSRISGLLGLDYQYTLKLLEELLKEKRVVKNKETMATYWRLI